MARPIEEFVMAWRALSVDTQEAGWRTIAVTPAGPCVLMAGRRFPGNEEAILAGFSSAAVPVAEKLPEGEGFEVSRADPYGDEKTWIALTRKGSGSLELFTEVVGDVAGALDAAAGQSEKQLLRTFLARIRSWQEFMRKGVQTLSPEAELGLVGELSFLADMIEAGVPAQLAVESWVGPLDGVQDFELGIGAVEVKATQSSQGFPAKIGSLEQLNDVLRKPLLLAGVRFTQRESGQNLPEFASAVVTALGDDTEAQRMFADRLLAAGLRAAHTDHYLRRFVLDKTRIVEVTGDFPRLIPGTVPAGIRHAVYEIDLDRAAGPEVSLVETLRKLGVV